MTTTKDLVWREVVMERPYEMETLQSILTSIAALIHRGPVVWEARCQNGRMRYLMGTPPRSVGRLQEVLLAHANVQFAEHVTRKPVSAAKRLKISKPVLQLNTEVASATIRAALAAMTSGRPEQETVVQILLGAAYTPSSIPKNMPDPTASWLSVLLGSVHNATADQLRSARDKASQYRFDATIRIGMSGERTETRLYNLISALRTLESAGAHIHATTENPAHLNTPVMPWRAVNQLSAKEAACFLLLPVGEDDLPGTPGLHPKRLLPPKWYREPKAVSTSRIFAVTTDVEQKQLAIRPKDALEHTVLLGPTGAGKSTAMLNLVLADIKAGRSVLVIDPKADLVTDVLERIPDNRKDDVVVLDPSDPCPVGFNPLAYHDDPSLTADAILAVFQEIFAQNWGIRSADVLSGALLTLAKTKGANLLYLPQLLTDERFRKEILAQVKDPIALGPFWRNYESMRDSERRTEIAPVLNKLRQITFRPGLRNVLGQTKPKFSLYDLFRERRIVLVPLNRGLIGAESARLLGSLIVGLTWTIALSRAKIAPEKRHMVSIYIDELQDYLALPTSFGDALAQARGLGIAYTVAHQYRAQLPQDIKAGIDANCRNKIIFGLNSDDAKAMAEQAQELEPLDFMTLPRYEVYTSFQSGGRSTGWISAATLPPPEATGLAAEIKAESMKRYGVPATETEAALTRIMTHLPAEPRPIVSEAPIGRKKKRNQGDSNDHSS